MFKSFQNTSRSQLFKGFPNLNFQMNNEAYGFSGCTFWLDAAYGLNTQTDGASIAIWIEKIRSRIYIQSTAGNQPRLRASDANYNNNPTIQFFDNLRFINTTNGFIPPSSYTIAIVGGINYGLAGSENVIWGNSISFNNSVMLGGSNASAKIGIRVAGTFNTGTINDFNPHIVILSSQNGIYVDGVLDKSTTLARFTEVLNQVGRGWNTTTNAGLCDVAEIISFDYSLSATESIELSDRLNQKYAIY
jgi:hypothetical protein